MENSNEKVDLISDVTRLIYSIIDFYGAESEEDHSGGEAWKRGIEDYSKNSIYPGDINKKATELFQSLLDQYIEVVKRSKEVSND